MPVRIQPNPGVARLQRPSSRVFLLATVAIVVGTVLVAVLERSTEIPDASAVYLVAVVIVGSVGGTSAAIATAIAAFVVYDFLFTEPRFSLVISDTNELLNLIVVLIVALVVGRLAALGRERAAEADRRAVEATGLFAVSRLLATADQTEAVAGPIVERLAHDAHLERVWIGLDGGSHERVLADTGTGPLPNAAIVTTLARSPDDEPARWIRSHDSTGRGASAGRPTSGGDVIRIRIETGGTVLGSLWAVKVAGSAVPGPGSTRLLSLAADQIALGIRRDRLHQDATSAEVARRSDALKGALLDSVSHDLRTPLASIRATAGNLADPDVPLSTEAVRRAADTIDEEAQRLDRFVRSILDLSRIESGALRPDLEVFDARELVERTVDRLRPALGDRPLTLRFDDDRPIVRADAVLFDAIVSNVLHNVADHTPPGTAVAIHARREDPDRFRVTIEDAGPGVPDADLPQIFDKFHRARRLGEGARRGMGVGLSIVRGMVEAQGGTATARRADLGGLAIDLELPVAPAPPVEPGP
jgi:two-component system sensor histidine kinase KdpD